MPKKGGDGTPLPRPVRHLKRKFHSSSKWLQCPNSAAPGHCDQYCSLSKIRTRNTSLSTSQTLNASSRQSRGVSGGLSQHCIQLRLGEIPSAASLLASRRLLPCEPGEHRPLRALAFVWARHDLRRCGWRLLPALQAHTQQLSAHGVAAAPQAAGDLPGTVAADPEFSPCIFSYNRSASADNIASRERRRDSRALPELTS